jgi:hypothetical protein
VEAKHGLPLSNNNPFSDLLTPLGGTIKSDKLLISVGSRDQPQELSMCHKMVRDRFGHGFEPLQLLVNAILRHIGMSRTTL